jgi:hypothetical protein
LRHLYFALAGTGRAHYALVMPKLLDEIYRLQSQLTELDDDEQLLLKMCANLLESHYRVKNPRNALTVEEYERVPGRWELSDGMLESY